MITLENIIDFADWFLEDPINQAILHEEDNEQLRREAWSDAVEYFGGESISSSTFNRMINAIKHRAKLIDCPLCQNPIPCGCTS